MSSGLCPILLPQLTPFEVLPPPVPVPCTALHACAVNVRLSEAFGICPGRPPAPSNVRLLACKENALLFALLRRLNVLPACLSVCVTCGGLWGVLRGCGGILFYRHGGLLLRLLLAVIFCAVIAFHETSIKRKFD